MEWGGAALVPFEQLFKRHILSNSLSSKAFVVLRLIVHTNSYGNSCVREENKSLKEKLKSCKLYSLTFSQHCTKQVSLWECRFRKVTKNVSPNPLNSDFEKVWGETLFDKHSGWGMMTPLT